MKKILFPIILLLVSESCDLPFKTKGDSDNSDIFTVSHDYTGEKIVHPHPVTLTWSDMEITRFKHFKVERGMGTGQDEIVWTNVATITDSLETTFTDSIEDDQMFQYRVRLVDKSNQFMIAYSEPFTVPDVTSLNVRDDYFFFEDAYESSFLDDGDTLFISPGNYTVNLRFLTKDIFFTSTNGAEQTVLVGVSDTSSVVEIHKGVMSGFTVRDGVGNEGGGVQVWGNAILEDCIITENKTVEADANIQIYPFGYGGGVYLTENALMRNCLVSDNWGKFGAGGILMDGYSKIEDCEIFRNVTKGKGGGILIFSDQCTVSGSSVRGNKSLGSTMGGLDDSFGGGIAAYTGNHAVTNTLLKGNYSSRGGGGVFVAPNATISFINSIFQKNRSGLFRGDNGSGLSYGDLTIRNTIVWDNTGRNPRFLWNESYFSNIDEISYIQTAHGNIREDPLFVDISESDYLLLPGSPCIDAGDSLDVYNDLDGSRNDMGIYGGPDPIQF
jgi:hypothetical protein